MVGEDGDGVEIVAEKVGAEETVAGQDADDARVAVCAAAGAASHDDFDEFEYE